MSGNVDTAGFQWLKISLLEGNCWIDKLHLRFWTIGDSRSKRIRFFLTSRGKFRVWFWGLRRGSSSTHFLSALHSHSDLQTPVLELDNGSCQNAFDVTTQLPYVATTSYMGTISNYSNVECGLEGIGHPGVWWKVTNTGTEEVAFIASLQNQARFDHISVFTGPSCTDLVCQVYLENGGLKRTLTWQAEAGQTSYIYVWFDFIDSLSPSFDILIEVSIIPYQQAHEGL